MGLLFVESIHRLYKSGKISKEKVLELFRSGKLTEKETMYILDVKN